MSLATLVRFRAVPGRGDDLVAALRRMLPAAEREEGTLVYALHRDADDPDCVLMYELYDGPGALEAHGASPEAARLGEDLGGLLADEPVVWTGSLLAMVPPAGAD